MHALPLRLLGLITFACLSLAGCASSKLANQWSNLVSAGGDRHPPSGAGGTRA